MTNHLYPQQAGPDRRVIQELIDEHYPFDCNVIPIDPDTWAIHGSIPVAGDVILAEFGTKDDAEAALVVLAEAEANRPAVTTRRSAS